MLIVKIILLASMLYIAYEDFRFRAVSLYSFIGFGGTAIIYSLLQQGLISTLKSSFWNLVIVIFQLAVTFLYFRLVKKQAGTFINKSLGAGDLIFLIPVLFLFSPINFICIYIVSLLLVLFSFALYTVVFKRVKTIPLAGGLSMVMSFFLAGFWIYKPAVLYDDMFIADFLYTVTA